MIIALAASLSLDTARERGVDLHRATANALEASERLRIATEDPSLRGLDVQLLTEPQLVWDRREEVDQFVVVERQSPSAEAFVRT